MFSRWGRFVYRRRRWVFLAALLIGFGMATFAGRRVERAVLGRLAGPGLRVAGRRRAPRATSGRGKGTLVLLYLGADGADATRPPSRPPSRARGRPRQPRSSTRSSATRRPATPASSARRRLRLRRGPARRLGRGVGRAPRRAGGRDRPPGDGSGSARRLRPADPRLGRAVREGPHPRRDDLAADRRDRPDPGLRVAHRRGPAAARRRPRDPDHAGRRLLRRPGDRASDLRPERLDDARPRPRDRLLAVHGQPVPRGAGGPDGGGGGRARSPPPARPSRSRASRSRWACRACSCSRPRRCARSASAARSRPRLAVLRPDVPAGDPRDARAARRAAVDRRPRRLGRRALGRPGAAEAAPPHDPLGAARARGDAPPGAVLVPTLAVLLIAGIPVLPARPGRPGRASAGGPREPRGGRRPPDGVPAGETTPIVVLADARATRRARPRSAPSPRTAAASRASTASTGREPVHGLRDPQTGAA